MARTLSTLSFMHEAFIILLLSATALHGQTSQQTGVIEMRSGLVTVHLHRTGFRFSFTYDGRNIASEHAESGLLLGGDSVERTDVHSCDGERCDLMVTTTNGATAEVTVEVAPHQVTVKVVPVERRSSIVLRTAGISPAFGLGDRTVYKGHDDTDISGIVEDRLHAGPFLVRMMSNLVIFPKQGMAEVLVNPNLKILHLTTSENAQGLPAAPEGATFYYLFGTPREIYAAFKQVRERNGYPIYMPKYAMFGVGWEAFGALGWETNQKTVQDSVDHYLALGFPLRWAVIGSGFWPEGDSNQETTSFGLFDAKKYPTPKELFDHFHKEGLKVLLGLRITFITTGPFAQEGVEHGYFLKENGQPIVFKTSWPKLPCYLLDSQNPEALQWYLNLVRKWTAFGVDGFKEDFFGYGKYDLRDDKLDPINQALMKEGNYIIERNGYLGSAGDLHRIEDFNFDQDQDRGPVNLLALAYSGLPLGYPDIVGGTFAEKHFDVMETPKLETYMTRNAQWASLHSSMSMGQPPWSFRNPKVGEIMLQAARTHERLHPYIYSQAVRFAHDGFPWTMTPLPLAFPRDPHVYGRENRRVRGYEWLIGDALLASPLYGDDYATANARDVYLPAGKWVDYDSGKIYSGPKLLNAYPIPVEKTPLFVGGTGIVIENGSKGLVVRAYPVTSQSQTEFWDADAGTRSEIVMKVMDWGNPIAFDLMNNHVVEGRWIRFAYEFPFIPGHNYEIR